MTTVSTSPVPRRRDAARSRERLLGAATELFAERGYDATTIRDIGERAGVDPALIARYFGSKTGLYVAVVRAEVGDAPPDDLRVAGRVLELLTRVRRRGAGPVFRSTVLPQEDAAVCEAVSDHLHERLVGPLRARYEAEGRTHPALRAELAVAAFTGIALARDAGTLTELAAADDELVAGLVDDLLAALG